MSPLGSKPRGDSVLVREKAKVCTMALQGPAPSRLPPPPSQWSLISKQTGCFFVPQTAGMLRPQGLCVGCSLFLELSLPPDMACVALLTCRFCSLLTLLTTAFLSHTALFSTSSFSHCTRRLLTYASTELSNRTVT